MSEVTAEQVKEVVMDTLNLHEEFEPEEIDVKASLFGDEGLGLDIVQPQPELDIAPISLLHLPLGP